MTTSSLHATVVSDAEMAPRFEKMIGFPVDYETLYWQGFMLAEAEVAKEATNTAPRGFLLRQSRVVYNLV